MKKTFKELKNFPIILGTVIILFVLFCVVPFAYDGYEQITSRQALDARIAQAIANHEPEVKIDYSGEDWQNLKSWIKTDFDYANLVTCGEYAAYNYNGAKFTYWTYGDRKRVKITISYKETLEEKAAVESYVDNIIAQNNLNSLSDYEKIKWVHDYMTSTFAYVNGVNNRYTVITTGQANCYGGTMLNTLFLEKLGIQVRTTTGYVNTSHIWNAVCLDGQWYYVDTTWDTVGSGYEYFLISTDQLRLTHTIQGNFIPDCPSNYIVSEETDTTEEVIEEVVEETETVIDEVTEIVVGETEETVEEESVETEENLETEDEETVKTEEVVETEKTEETVEEEKVEIPTDEKVEEPVVIETPPTEVTEKEDKVVEVSPKGDNTTVDDNNSSTVVPSQPVQETTIQRLLKLLKLLRRK